MSYFICALLVWLVVVPVSAQAAAVGRISQVEGEVDLLKQGKLPAVPVKLQDGVDPGDIIRTKSRGRAQITFMDDTTLSISPGSRVAIESYMYDAAQKQRHGVIQVFYGMVYTVVNKILQTEKPDILLKTHTAVMGVRGTKWYAVLHPIFTDIYNESGKVCASNAFPEVVGEVCLKDRQFTRVAWNMPPTVPAAASGEDFLLLQRQLSVGVKDAQGPGTGPPGLTGMIGLPPPGTLTTPGIGSITPGSPAPPPNIIPVITVQPRVTPGPPGPPPVLPPR